MNAVYPSLSEALLMFAAGVGTGIGFAVLLLIVTGGAVQIVKRFWG